MTPQEIDEIWNEFCSRPEISLKRKENMQKFLFLAAACGPQIPVNSILSFLKIDEEERDDFLQLFNGLFVDGEPAFFEDQGYSLSLQELVYLFRSDLIREHLLRHYVPAEADNLVTGLLETLWERYNVPDEFWARCILNLAEVAEGERAQEIKKDLEWINLLYGAKDLKNTF